MRSFLVIYIILAFALFAESKTFLDSEGLLESKLTNSGKVRKIDDQEILKVYIRGCGMVQVPRNSKGAIPKAGTNIRYSQNDRCVISDWRN